MGVLSQSVNVQLSHGFYKVNVKPEDSTDVLAS